MKILEKKYLKFWILLGGYIFLLLFFPVNRENIPHKNEIIAPKEVMDVLRRSCYDCHSTVSKWPWYSYVFPVSLVVSHHIEEGRKELNFSDFEDLSNSKKFARWESILEEVEEREMPPRYYTFFHKGTELSAEEIQILKNWKEKIEKQVHE
jgi:hypothetical protein